MFSTRSPIDGLRRAIDNLPLPSTVGTTTALEETVNAVRYRTSNERQLESETGLVARATTIDGTVSKPHVLSGKQGMAEGTEIIGFENGLLTATARRNGRNWQGSPLYITVICAEIWLFIP